MDVTLSNSEIQTLILERKAIVSAKLVSLLLMENLPVPYPC